MKNDNLKIPEIITVEWLRETINELDNKLEIIVNSNEEFSRLLEEKQITYEVYREKLDNSHDEMMDLRKKKEILKKLLKAFAYDRIMQDTEAIDKLVQGYKENVESRLSEKRSKKAELEHELTMLKNDHYVLGYNKRYNLKNGYNKMLYLEHLKYGGRTGINIDSLKEVAKELCTKTSSFDPSSFFDDVLTFFDNYDDCVYQDQKERIFYDIFNKYNSVKLFKGMSVWDFCNCCEQTLESVRFQESFANSNFVNKIKNEVGSEISELYIFDRKVYKKSDIINSFKKLIDNSNMGFSFNFTNLETISNLQISFMASLLSFNTVDLGSVKPIMELKDDYVTSRISNREGSLKKIDRDIEYLESRQHYLNNTDKKQILASAFTNLRLDSSIKPVSEDSKIILEHINSLVKKLSNTNNAIHYANSQIDSYGKEIVDLHLEFMEKGFSYDDVRYIYQNNIETENKIEEQEKEISDLEKEIEKIKLDINGCEDEKKNKESEKVDTEQKKEFIEYFNPRKNKSVEGKIGRFFFRLFNKKQYLANQESYTKKMNEYSEQIKSLESKINGLKNNMAYKKRDIGLAETEKNNLKLNIRTGEIRQNGATVTVDQIMSYCTHYSSYLVDNIKIKKSSTEEYNQIISDIRKKVSELKAIPNLTEDIMEFANQLQNQIDSGEINYESEFNIQSLDSSIRYDKYLRNQYQNLSPELFNKLYRGEYSSEMSLDDAEDTLTGSEMKK